MTTYAVGDIQGCFKPLKRLLKQVGFDKKADRLWAVGDLVNRGPHNLDTLRWFYKNREHVTVVLGNHDLHLIAIHRGKAKLGRSDNLQDILAAPDADELVDWLRHQPLLHREGNDILVHAGVPPCWSAPRAQELANEVEGALQGSQCDRFLGAMYGNEPWQWTTHLKGLARLRVITNYLTRMRYCTRKGKLDLISKGPQPIPDAIAGKKVAPWFSHKRRLTKGQTIIFGHWASLEGMTDSKKTIGLDTGCVWGNALTFYKLETGERFTCDCKT